MFTRQDLLNEKKNQNTSLLGDTVDAFQAGAARSVGGMASFVGLDSAAEKMNEIANAQYRTMTPESQVAMGKRLINDDLSLGEGITDGRTWLLSVAQIVGDMAPTILPGGAVGKGISLAGRVAKAGEGVAKVAGAANMGTLVATNLSSAGGQAGLAARDDIMNLSYEDLADSPIFQELAVSYHKKGMSQEDALSKAQQDIADEVKNRITYDPTMMVINGTLGALGDKAMTKVVSGKLGRTIKGAIGKAIVAEGGTEAAQGAAQQRTQNVESNKAAGTEIYDPNQGVAQQSIEGGILGAVVGGSGGAVGGGVGKVRRRSFEKNVEGIITPQAITDAKASGLTDGEIRKSFENSITNAALERGFEVDEAETMAKNAVMSAFGEGPTAEQRASMEDAQEQSSQSEDRQRPEGAERRDQMVAEQRASREEPKLEAGEPNPRDFGLKVEDAELLIDPPAELFDSNGNFAKPAKDWTQEQRDKLKELKQQYQVAQNRRGAEEYVQAVTDYRYNNRKPYQESLELAQVPEQANEPQQAQPQEVEPTLSQEDIYGQLGLPSDYQPTEAAQRVRLETGTDLQQELANQEQISKPAPNIRREREMIAPTEAAQRVRSQLPEFEAEAQRRQQAEESQLTAEQEAEAQRERDLNRGFEAQQSFNKEGKKATNQAKQSQVEPTRQIEQSTVYQPRQQTREQVRYEEPAPTAEEIIERNRGKRAGVLKGNLGESMPAKRNKRQVKKAKSKLKAAQQTIYDRITKSDPLATNEVEQDFAATTGYTPNSAMMEAFEALKPTKKEPTPEEVEQRVDELEDSGTVEKADADAIRLQARRDYINEYELPDDAPVWMQQDQDNIDKLKDSQVNELYKAIQGQESPKDSSTEDSLEMIDKKISDLRNENKQLIKVMEEHASQLPSAVGKNTPESNRAEKVYRDAFDKSRNLRERIRLLERERAALKPKPESEKTEYAKEVERRRAEKEASVTSLTYERARKRLDKEVEGFLSSSVTVGLPDIEKESSTETEQSDKKTPAVRQTAKEAAKETNTNPTEAQKEAGNYKKGSFDFHGLTVAIENPKGSERSGTNSDGESWSVTMKNHYGYIKRTEGADGDAVDVFVGPNEASKIAYIIDQVDPKTGTFDEHKVMLGFTKIKDAKKAYLENYTEGWKGFGEMSVVKLDDFKKWLNDGDLSKPYSNNFPEPTPPEGPKGTKKGGYTRTQTAPRGNEKTKPQSLKGYKAQIEDVSEGKASREDMIELAKNFRDDHDAMIAELNSMTMPKIKEMMGQHWSMMHKDYNKANLVEAAWGDLMKNFLFAITADHFISTGGQRGRELGDYVIGKLEAVSVDDYNAVQAKKAEKAKAEAAEAKRRKEALDNPITLQDFVAYARDKGEGIESFSPEQLKRYDELMTEQQVLKLKERQQKAAEIRAVDGEVSYQLAKTVHTKLNEPRYVVQLTGERLGKEAFKDLAARARQLGGNFVNAMQAKRYNTIDGFQFANVEDRNTFAQLLDGEQVSSERRQAEKLESKQDSRVTKLKEMADKLEADANEEINRPRKTNTAKRSREAASAMDSAYSNQHDARLMRGIAEATEADKVELLGNLSQKVQLDELLRARGAITWNLPEDRREQFAYRNEQGNWKLKPETKLDDILYWVKYPAPEARVETLHRIADAMEGVKGFKQAANKIRSNTKTLNSSDNAVLKGRQWETATSKIREFARKNKDEYVAQWLNELFLREDRLNRMGINGPAALRNTLRELSNIEKTISSDRPIETPVTKLEREITETIQNNRNAYNDFFPTDNDALADHVVELADIQVGEKVLEPNAGMGHLADKIKAKGADLEVGELAYKMQNLLEEKGHKVVSGDFLEYNPGPIYDKIVMNPPFSNDADVKHVTHAISMLKPGGRLVAITGAMAGDKSNSANKNFREYLDSVDAVEEANAEGSFKNSINPTGVSTKTIVIDKPEDPANLPVPDDIRFSQSSVVTEQVKGMSATAVENEAQKWLDNYDGLKAANIQVVEKQSDLSQWVETEPEATVKGVWLSGDNRVVLVAENLISMADVRKTLRHELIAHNGLYGNLSSAERDALTNKVMKLRGNAKLKSIFNEVDNSYKNAPDDVKAEEVIARIAESESGKLRQVVDRVMAMIMGALRRSGVLSQEKVTISEVRNMINGVDRYLRRNDGTLSLPNAVRFSQRVDKVEGLDKSYDAILEGTQQSFMQKVLSKTLDKSKVRDALKSGGWNFLTLRQTADVAAKKVSKQFASHIDNYMGEMNQMTADEGRATQDILSTFEGLDKWRRKNKAESDRVFDFMHDLTLENVDPTQEYADMTPELVKAKASLQAQIRSRSGEANAKKVQEITEIDQQIKNEPRREKIHERRRKEFLALPKESQEVIKKIADHYTKQREDVTNALMEKATDLAMDGGKIGKAMMLKIRLDNEIAKKGFYVPLARFGDYFIDGINENGERVFTMYQTQAEMDRAFDRLHAAGYEVKKGKTTEQRAGLDSVSASFVTKMTQELETTTMSEKARDELKDRVYQLYLDTLPTRSIRKQFIHRKGVAGFSKDALQALADQGAKQAKQLSRLKHEDKMQQQLDALNKEYEDLKSRPEGSEDRVSAARIMDSMSKRHEWVMNPQRAAWASKMTGFGFFWLIGASPASALINVTQNVQVALPVIGAKYGVAKTGQVMAGLTGDFIKNFKAAHADMDTRRKHGILGSTILKGDELKAMEEAIAMGVIDTTQTHDLIGLAENQTSEITDTTAKVMRGIGWMFHHAEVLNREVTFMTAYRMAKNAGESHAAAKDYAVKATWDSHFDYGSLNRAKFMQGDVASVALQFKQYSQNMTFYLVHNFLQAFALKNPVTGTFFSTVSKNTTAEERAMARKQLMGTMAATFLIGGLGAMPVATLAAIANMAHDIVGDDDEPWDAETELKGIMAEWFGEELADGMYYGLGTMVGLPNISSRIEIDPKSMWFRDSYSMDSQGAFKEQALNALGPTFSILTGAAKGFDYIFREQKYQQGFESIAPKWVRDVSKTARYLGEGGAITNRQGDVVVADLSPLEYAEQLLGFTPSRQLVQGAKNRAYKDYERQIMDRRKLLMNSMWQTYRTNDVEGMKNVWKRIDKFNKSDWGRLNPITQKTVNQSMRIRARGQSKAKNGIRINDKYTSQLNAMYAAN